MHSWTVWSVSLPGFASSRVHITILRKFGDIFLKFTDRLVSSAFSLSSFVFSSSWLIVSCTILTYRAPRRTNRDGNDEYRLTVLCSLFLGPPLLHSA